MDFGYLIQKFHNYLNVLNLLTRLDLTVICQTILIKKDRLWILRHHHNSNLIFNKLKIQLCILQVFVVLLIPRQVQQSGYQLELKHKVNAWLIAAIY